MCLVVLGFGWMLFILVILVFIFSLFRRLVFHSLPLSFRFCCWVFMLIVFFFFILILLIGRGWVVNPSAGEEWEVLRDPALH